jgi:hypothetical protein
MHMWHHVTNHLIVSNDKDSNSENRIKLRVRDTDAPVGLVAKRAHISEASCAKSVRAREVCLDRGDSDVLSASLSKKSSTVQTISAPSVPNTGLTY